MAAPTLITFVAGQPALAEDVNDNFDSIAGKFNGGIADSDISDTAKIKGYKLSNTPGEQIVEDRLGNNAVSARVLQSDATAGHALAAVATADHIKDGIITNDKMLPATLLSGSMKLLLRTRSMGTLSLPPGTTWTMDLHDDVAWSGGVLAVGSVIPLSAWLSKAWPLGADPPRTSIILWKDLTPNKYAVTLTNTNGVATIDYTGCSLTILMLYVV